MGGSTKKFSLGTVLSITTGRLLTDIENIYKISDHMTGRTNYTHELPRCMDECKPTLMAMCPELEGVDLGGLDRSLSAAADGASRWDAIDKWLDSTGLPEMFNVPTLA